MSGWDARPDVPTYTFADVPSLAGKEFEGTWVSIDQEKMDLFDESTYYDSEDYGWDVGNFPRNLVEGFHLLSLLPPLMNLAYKIEDPNAFLLNYGLDRVRFVTPVYAGDLIRATGCTTEVIPKDEGYIVAKSVAVELKDAPRPAMVAEQRSLVLPKVRDQFLS